MAHMRFVSGFASGVTALVFAELVAWGTVVAAPYRSAYVEFSDQLPPVTRLALSAGWIFGLAAGLALATTALNLWWRGSERSRAISLAALAALSLGLAVGTAYAGVYPSAQLAGRISAE